MFHNQMKLKMEDVKKNTENQVGKVSKQLNVLKQETEKNFTQMSKLMKGGNANIKFSNIGGPAGRTKSSLERESG